MVQWVLSKTRPIPNSLSFKGQATKYTTVEWGNDLNESGF